MLISGHVRIFHYETFAQMLYAGCLQAFAAVVQILSIVIYRDSLEFVGLDVMSMQMLRETSFCAVGVLRLDIS